MRAISPRFLLVVLTACHQGLGDPPPPSDLRELRVVAPDENEICPDEPLHFPAPVTLLEHEGIDCDLHHTWCFRLAPGLGEVARGHDPLVALALSADVFDADLEAPDEALRSLARAYADLAVSGRESFLAFAALAPTRADVPSEASDEAIDRALERAYEVAWALRGPASHRLAARDELGWIAVSPEDDLPDAPVNVRSAPYPTAELVVSVPLPDGTSRDVRTRVVIASTQPAPESVVPAVLVGAVPPPTPFEIPDDDAILLYLHGHSSRAEEAVPLATALLEEAVARGVDMTLLSVELPSNGYSERIDPDEILATATTRDAILRFYDSFLVSFVDGIDALEPNASERIALVLGGSLGANLALRMAESSEGRVWPERVAVWSPVSIDYSWLRAKLPFAAGDGEFVDIVKHEAVRLTENASRSPEDGSSREDFFTAGFTSVETQAAYWYRPNWQPCRDRATGAGLAQLGEVYDSRLRRWHYRVAYEQLVFSHIEADENGELRFERIDRPLFLAAGEADDSPPMSTWRFVERLAPFLEVPGPTVLVRGTGHTMHIERPHLVAREIAAFCWDG